MIKTFRAETEEELALAINEFETLGDHSPPYFTQIFQVPLIVDGGIIAQQPSWVAFFYFRPRVPVSGAMTK